MKNRTTRDNHHAEDNENQDYHSSYQRTGASASAGGAGRLFSPVRTPAPAPTIRERATRLTRSKTAAGTPQKPPHTPYTPRRSAPTTAPQSSARRPPLSMPPPPALQQQQQQAPTSRTLERQFKTIISTLEAPPSAARHKRTFSSTNTGAAGGASSVSPPDSSSAYPQSSRSSQSLASRIDGGTGRSGRRETGRSSQLQGSNGLPVKKRKVVTFQDRGIANGRSPPDNDDTFHDAAENPEGEYEDDEVNDVLQGRERGDRILDFASTRSKLSSAAPPSSSQPLRPDQPSAAMFLELECELKQVQLDSLRRFKELQTQMQVQAKQIQDLREENKALRALYKS